MDSAAEPAPTTPSPRAPATLGAAFSPTVRANTPGSAGPTPPAADDTPRAPAAIKPRETTPPAPMDGADSVIALTIRDGLEIATPALLSTPSASWNCFCLACRSSDWNDDRYSLACFGRKPKAPPSFSRNLPTAPPVGMSSRPTAASGTPTTPLARDMPRSPTLRITPAGSGGGAIAPASQSMLSPVAPAGGVMVPLSQSISLTADWGFFCWSGSFAIAPVFRHSCRWSNQTGGAHNPALLQCAQGDHHAPD